ncbi:MAG: GSCFA domain-containing protein [Flavobacteriales bacterium]|nr:GSCFA domain-containing protein [Flavobacteriales bacterium]
MTQFRTEVTPNPPTQKLSYKDDILLVGSCFSENIGSKFAYFGFNSMTNPFGVVFNPISIANILYRIVANKTFEESDFHFDQGRWFCFETHGDLAALTKEECLAKHNEALSKASKFLKKTSCLIITFGSAWIYEHIDSGNIVANCHKVPNKKFTKRLLSKEEVVESFRELIKNFELSAFNFPLLFTLSPVRHLKDGVVENQRSKSVLHLAIQQLVEDFESVSYFPAYEIMMDDLRDYRFYNRDMLHPNQQAVDYIWERFKESSIDNSCFKLMARVDKVRNGLAHWPFNENSDEYKNFKKKLAAEIEAIKVELPSIQL